VVGVVGLMAINGRYIGRNIYRTRNPLYAQDMEKRGLKEMRYYGTPEFKKPTRYELSDITDVGHIWRLGDRYYKLAHEYYGDSELWWIIAWYNGKPTEAHVKLGDIISIPTPLWKIRSAYGV